MKTKQFPNGFTSWSETHFEVVQHLVLTIDKKESMANAAQAKGGHAELFVLADSLTDEFENKYKGEVWGVDREWWDEIDSFLIRKENEHKQL